MTDDAHDVLSGDHSNNTAGIDDDLRQADCPAGVAELFGRSDHPGSTTAATILSGQAPGSWGPIPLGGSSGGGA